MANRLKTRISAGAALVTGLGMMGLATAVPAQAAATMQYSCTTPLGPQVLDVTLDTDAPETATTGEALTITPSGTVTLNENISNGMAGALAWEDVSADIPGVVATISNGTDSADFTTDLTIPRTTIFTNGTWVTDSTPDLPITGTAQSTAIAQAGSYTVSAPDTFNTTFHGFNAAGETGTLSPIASICTYVPNSGSKVIDTVTVTDEPTTPEPTTPEPTTPEPTTPEPTTPEPTVEVDDWFDEPSSLPITSDQKHFSITGTADHAGTIDVVLLDADKKVLRTISWDVTEGSNTKEFSFAEGTGYVRIVSQDCVDADGNDGSVSDSGCNVEYYAPWVNPDDSETSTDDGDDNAPTGPETPGVVQTDGFTRVQEPAGNNTAAFLLGGALLAGAGAGSIVLARRRQGAQH
ncbi:hypothetical protein ASG73_06935 [Janibacter sp. Soil728]|uniref:DUF6801 domain-containing protein n=1 Tax=Janibacter sp. Soil728 TaxID=1736393 RepID=UPI0006F65B29|nr:DUF6801 domain-containing protein [Janibacter sp. Soil728]KRE37410.1 hypothetical protein ASG73_06935 [Janibacter sp. Soil728]